MPEVPQNSAPAAATAAPPPSETKQPAVQQSSMAAELSRVYDEKAAAAKVPPEKASGPTAISPGQGNVAPEQKARGEDGRFAASSDKKDAKSDTKSDKAPEQKPEGKKDDKAKPEDAKVAEVKAAEAKAAEEKTAKERADKIAKIQPHPRWKPEVAERFKKLTEADPDSASFVLEREKEAEKFITQASQAGAKFKALEDILAPGRQQRSMAGVDDATFMRSLVAASDFLAKEPAKGLKMLAEQYGVDLKTIGEAGESATESPQVRQLQEQVTKLTNYIQSLDQGAAKQRMVSAFQSIKDFSQQRDEKGQLLYPHFEEVVDDVTIAVAQQRAAGQQPNLKAAYEKAIRLNDTVWTKTQATKSDAERKQREEEEVRRVADAKLAGFSVSGSGATGDSVAGSIRDELRRQIDKAYR